MFKNKYASYLKDKAKNESFIEGLKIKFRSFIFPTELLLNQLNASDTIFDIGCGSGQFSLLSVHFKKVKTVYGLEIKERLVASANNLLKTHTRGINYTFFIYDRKTLPSEIKLCNKVFLNDVLHHIPKANQINFIRDIYKKMSKGSTFILKDINASSPLVYFNKLHDIIFSGEIGKEMPYKKALKALGEIGFKIITTEKRNILLYPHYTIICKKE